MRQAGSRAADRSVHPRHPREGPTAPGMTHTSVSAGPCSRTVACSAMQASQVFALASAPMSCDDTSLPDKGQVARAAVSRTGWPLQWPVCGVCGEGWPQNLWGPSPCEVPPVIPALALAGARGVTSQHECESSLKEITNSPNTEINASF